jgi:hypothetical protein
MKRKRDLPDEDQNLRSKKKQKCQHLKLGLIKEGDSIEGPNTDAVLLTGLETSQS